MKMRTWILPLCMLLVLGCDREEGQQQTAAPEPNRDVQPVGETAAGTLATVDEPGQGVQPARAAVVSIPSKLGDPAWPLTGLTWIKGGPVEITPGKVYVVEFWATWCPPCRVSIPHLTQIQQTYKDKGVIIVGISQEHEGKVRPFVEQKGSEMNYTVAVDATGAVSKGYMDVFNPEGRIPCAFVVDAQGKLAWVGHPMDHLDAVLDRTLAAASGAQ